MEPVYDPDTGELIGYTVMADDGALVVFDPEAETIIGVQDPSGEWVDPDSYELVHDEPDALDERLDRIEAAVNEPRPMPDVLVTRGLEQADVGRIEEDMHRQAAHLESALGRPLLVDERRRIAHQTFADIEAGDSRPDLYDAAHKSGGLLDLDSGNRGRDHEARTEWMTARMNDQERLSAQERGEDDIRYPERPASREEYDRDDGPQRRQWMADAMRGATDSSTLYSSSDINEWES